SLADHVARVAHLRVTLPTSLKRSALHMWPVAMLISCGTARPYPSTHARVAPFMGAINAARASAGAAATISPAGTADRCRSRNSSGGGGRRIIRREWAPRLDGDHS